jgi:hypothetical protein
MALFLKVRLALVKVRASFLMELGSENGKHCSQNLAIVTK